MRGAPEPVPEHCEVGDASIFHDLMPYRIREILLVSCPYDAFIMEEDGGLAERIVREYHGLNLSSPPRIRRVLTGEDALAILARVRIDLVLLMPRLSDTTPDALCRAIRKQYPALPIHLMAHEMLDLETDPSDPDYLLYDRAHLWRGDTELLLSIVKSAEDRMNVRADIRLADVKVMVYVEDDPGFRSLVLPFLYREVVRQTRSVMVEAENDVRRMQKMRSRPKILIAETFEEAEYLIREFAENLLCVITDSRFQREGADDNRAGIRLLPLVQASRPDLPCVVLSTQARRREETEAFGATFIDKKAPDFMEALRLFLEHRVGFGDFAIRSESGEVVGRASSIQSMIEIFDHIPEESVRHHAGRHDFARWLAARMEFSLSRRLMQISAEAFSDSATLREFIRSTLVRCVAGRRKGILADFHGNGQTTGAELRRIGTGSMGGKARGLAFLAHRLHAHAPLAGMEGEIRVEIPESVVLATDCFDRFVEANRLEEFDPEGMADGAVAERFASLHLPFSLRADLRTYLEEVHDPIAVRSSGLIEDSPIRPCAGIYHTEMLANTHPDIRIRLRRLEAAILRVYASFFMTEARRFRDDAFQNERTDKMAVILQKVAGRRHGNHFFPAISGVLQSRNFYPLGPLRPEDGIAHVAIGLGRSVVGGGSAIRFSPKHPQFLPHFSLVDDVLKHGQRTLFALDLDSEREAAEVALPVSRVSGHPELAPLFSQYIPEDHRIREGQGGGWPCRPFRESSDMADSASARPCPGLWTRRPGPLGGQPKWSSP